MSRPTVAVVQTAPTVVRLLSLLVVFPFCACSDGAPRHDAEGAAVVDTVPRSVPDGPAAGGAASAEAPPWTGRFTLPDGSLLTLAAPPMAVLPGSAGSVDMLAALLPPERLAGLPAGCEQYSAVRAADSPYLQRPSFAAFRAEQLLGLAPDLVIAHSWQPADTIARLQEAGVPVLRLADGNSWAEVRAQLLLLGRILDVDSKAAALLADYDRRVEALLAGQGGQERLSAVCYSNGGAGGWVAGSETTLDEILRLAGLTNLVAEHGSVGHSTMTFEELLVLDPDVLVVGGAAEGQQAGGTAAFLRDSAALSTLRAVRGERIVVLPSWLYTTTSQYMVDAAEQLAERVAPWHVSVDR